MYNKELDFYGLNDKKNRKLRWKVETKGLIESIPAICGDNILGINNSKRLLSIHISTGTINGEMKR
jgi:hypothetical protein